MRKIRIETGDNYSPVVNNWKIFLDGVDISRFVQKVEIIGEVGEIAKVRLTCIETELELPDELKDVLVTAEK